MTAFTFTFAFIFRSDQLKELPHLLLLLSWFERKKEGKRFFLLRSSLILTDISNMTSECGGVVSVVVVVEEVEGKKD